MKAPWPLAVTAAFITTLALAPPASAAPAVQVTELPLPEGYTLQGPPDINARGQIAAAAVSDETRRSRIVRWDPEPGGGYDTTVLTEGPHVSSLLARINDRGDVLAPEALDLVIWDARGRKVATVASLRDLSGYSGFLPPGFNDRRQVLYGKGMGDMSGLPAAAVLWSPGGQAELTRPDGSATVDPGDLNDRGEAMGTATGTGSGFRWDGRTTTLFRGPDGESVYWMIDFNDRGQALGITHGGTRAFVNHRGVSQDIGTLGGPGTYLHPFGSGAINDRGQVAGASATAGGTMHPFIWHRGKMTDLGTLGGEATALYQATATDINNRGQVIGQSMTAAGELHPYAWHRGRMHDLHVPGFRDAVPSEINDRGQAIGRATSPTGTLRPLLWTLH
ncbi:hypothetical protein [Spirillospora sp. NPDC029432]|uniref:hypothetical protein n=1 Tax=Spirillospora sp. NPDC029432 TaxID=3154599 RepID=UPI0034540A83